MNIRRIHIKNPGFALPTVLIASVVMLAVLATSVAAATSTRSALQAEYYNQLARDAGDSGLAMAKACIAAGATTWANPLRPGGDCTGLAAQCTTASCYVMQSGDVRTTFEVSPPAIAGNVNTVTVTGKLEQTRTSTGAVWRSYTQTIRKQAATNTGAPPTAMLWSQVSAGGASTCALSSDNKAYCWGGNTNGQLGDGTTTQRSTPSAVLQGSIPNNVSILQISAGNTHVCALGSDYKAYCWGNNANGQLGDNSTTNRTTPVAVDLTNLPAGATIRQIAAGNSHTCAVASDNKAYCWGLNTNGQVGDNGTTQRTIPVAVTTTNIPAAASVIQVSAGGTHSCLITTDYKGFCWGNNGNGRLGDNSSTQRLLPTAVNQGQITAGETLIQISAGTSHTCAVASNNKSYCWGMGTNGRIGDNTTSNRLTPYALNTTGAISSTATIVQITSGDTFTCAISHTYSSYCWGNNATNQLGDGTTTQSLISVAVSQGNIPAGALVRQISSGTSHTCTLASDHKIYCWGLNTSGQLGDNSTTDRSTPVAVSAIQNANNLIALQVSSGDGHVCALASDYKAYCWGNGAGGRLGNSSTSNSATPVAVSQGAMPAGTTFLQIVASTNGTCGLGSDYKAYCWGPNDSGQVGDNTTTQRTSPVAVNLTNLPANATIRQLTSANSQTCAIASDNKAYCWGLNTNGQLGDNSTTQRLIPVAVNQGTIPATATIRHISAGGNFTCAIASDNKTYCWGGNSVGQLGNNTTTQSLTPVAVQLGALPTGQLVRQISSGDDYTCTIASDNKVYCWGGNFYGQIGDNSTTNRLLPVAVSTTNLPSGAMSRQVANGFNFACTIASDNKVYCWGANGGGHLGDSTMTDRLIPVATVQGAMPSGQIARQVSAGKGAVCAISSNGRLYCWGDNAYSKLGDNTTDNRSSAVLSNPFVVYTPSTSTYYF